MVAIKVKVCGKESAFNRERGSVALDARSKEVSKACNHMPVIARC
jgi:hypothetical protein